MPWQILAAINEIETDYGTDLSVSTAGAVGWMQFMPATWLHYGVDALNAGYADPYNPVDAIFAAARYLRAAGAAQNLSGAILAYNHSEEYADSVLLRAKLISTYPQSVIETLTGLVDDRPPVTGQHDRRGAARGALLGERPLPATAASRPRQPQQRLDAAGSVAPPLAHRRGRGRHRQARRASSRQPPKLIDLLSAPHAAVVAVQDGRIVKLGALAQARPVRDPARPLRRLVHLRRARLASPAATACRQPTAPRCRRRRAVATDSHDPAPQAPASAGRQLPETLTQTTPLARL